VTELANDVLKSHDDLVSTSELFLEPRHARISLEPVVRRSRDNPVPLNELVESARGFAFARLAVSPFGALPRRLQETRRPACRLWAARADATLTKMRLTARQGRSAPCLARRDVGVAANPRRSCRHGPQVPLAPPSAPGGPLSRTAARPLPTLRCELERDHRPNEVSAAQVRGRPPRRTRHPSLRGVHARQQLRPRGTLAGTGSLSARPKIW
jgi:hypothetical protein